jgi:hypothetical protein
VSSTTKSTGNIFAVTEFWDTPFVIEPYSLFGMEDKFHATYQAVTEVKVGIFTKFSYFTVVNDFLICRLNIINILCNRAQTLNKKLWHDDTKNDFQSKIIRFILSHCEKPEGKKIVKIKLYDFAKLINTSHVNTSIALSQLEKEGLIQTERMSVIVPDAKKLAEHY